MDLTNCALCEQVIIKGNCIYRGFDNTYCSKLCLRKQCFAIDIIDPEHKTPAKWKEANNAYIINIPEEIENTKVESPKICTETKTSKLSLVQYSILIASTFGICYHNSVPLL